MYIYIYILLHQGKTPQTVVGICYGVTVIDSFLSLDRIILYHDEQGHQFVSFLYSCQSVKSIIHATQGKFIQSQKHLTAG